MTLRTRHPSAVQQFQRELADAGLAPGTRVRVVGVFSGDGVVVDPGTMRGSWHPSPLVPVHLDRFPDTEAWWVHTYNCKRKEG